MTPVRLERESPGSPDATTLMELLDAELRALYPEQLIHGLGAEERRTFSGLFLVARDADGRGRALGCGAIRPLAPGVGEVKRMFVVAEHRGRGIARAILAELEVEARARGWRSIRLETGSRQPEAIALYESAGYARIPPYGEYIDDPFTVCLEKEL